MTASWGETGKKGGIEGFPLRISLEENPYQKKEVLRVVFKLVSAAEVKENEIT